MIFAVDHPLCDVWNQKKNSISYWMLRSNPKKYSKPAKKVQLGFRRFCPYFLLLTTPYVMFESKQNSNSNCSSEGRYRSNPKKYSKPPKKVQLGFWGFCQYFLLLTPPMWCLKANKTQIFIAHQKEDIDRTQKRTASHQKKYS